MIENIPPKGVSFSDLICIFAMSIVGFSCLFCNTKISEFFDMTKSLGNFLLLRYLKSLIYNSVAELRVFTLPSSGFAFGKQSGKYVNQNKTSRTKNDQEHVNYLIRTLPPHGVYHLPRRRHAAHRQHAAALGGRQPPAALPPRPWSRCGPISATPSASTAATARQGSTLP